MSRNPETGYRKLRTSLIKVELEECPNVLYNDRALRAEGQQRRVIKKAIQLRLPNNRNRVAWCRGKLNLPLIGCWVRVVSLFIDEFKVEVGANKRANKFREELEKNGTRHAWIHRLAIYMGGSLKMIWELERLKQGNVHMWFSCRSGYRPFITPPLPYEWVSE